MSEQEHLRLPLQGLPDVSDPLFDDKNFFPPVGEFASVRVCDGVFLWTQFAEEV